MTSISLIKMSNHNKVEVERQVGVRNVSCQKAGDCAPSKQNQLNSKITMQKKSLFVTLSLLPSISEIRTGLFSFQDQDKKPLNLTKLRTCEQYNIKKFKAEYDSITN